MRKPSTSALRRRGELQDGQLTMGLDLGDRSSFYCVLNGAGEVILEKRVATNPEAMKETFSTMPRSRIALETGTHSPWVSRVLTELGHEVIVAHARNVRLIGESRRKTTGWTRRPWPGWPESIRSYCRRFNIAALRRRRICR
jgi:transposase